MKIWFDIIAAKLASLIEEEFEAKTGSATSQQRHHRTSKLFQDNFSDISTDWRSVTKNTLKILWYWKVWVEIIILHFFHKCEENPDSHAFFYSRARTEPSANVTNMTRVSL